MTAVVHSRSTTPGDPGRCAYLLGRLGCLLVVKIGSTHDPTRRRSTVGEDRTATPPMARHRCPIMLAVWSETDGPTEAAMLADLAEYRWRSRTGRLSEYVDTHPEPVRALLAEHAPDWRRILTCPADDLRPLLAPWQVDPSLPIPGTSHA